MNWNGVIPAITTPFDATGAVDHAALGRHCALVDRQRLHRHRRAAARWARRRRLSFDEKLAIAATCVRAVGNRAPVVPGIASLSTAEAVQLARGAERRDAPG